MKRLFLGLGEVSVDDEIAVKLETDSASAIPLLSGLDLPRRSRHIEIRVAWIRDKLERGFPTLEHRSGLENNSDLLTKCLPTKSFLKHRTVMGFEQLERSHVESMMLQDEYILFRTLPEAPPFAFVEVCCERDSQLYFACQVSGIPYIGITANIQSKRLQNTVKGIIEKRSGNGVWIHVHASTPCSSGSPLKGFNKESVTATDLEWRSIIQPACQLMQLGDSRSFELPTQNEIWKRDEAINMFAVCGLVHEAQIFLCQTGVVGKDKLPVGKSLTFKTSSSGFAKSLHHRFGTCTCKTHAAFGQTCFSETARYTRKLARGILHAVVAARREP